VPEMSRGAGYPGDMPTLERLRARLPLVVFVLLLILALLLLGFVCLCMSDHPVQAIERALLAIPSLPALVELWSLAVAVLVAAQFARARPRLWPERASPALLQCFRF
jgi:hypothetical protein